MQNIYIGLSTNLGDKLANFNLAILAIKNLPVIILKTSSIYQTESWGIDNQEDYFNQVIEIESTLSAEELLTNLQSIENQMGRTRTYKFAPRLIDLDILYFDQEIIQTDNLTVPHPLATERNFVLTPLAEIAGDFIDPIQKKSINHLLQKCPDTKKVELLK